MTNQLNLTFPAVKHRLFASGVSSRERTKALVLALCLSIIPALGIGATGYHFANRAATKPIAQVESGETKVSPILQKNLLLELALFSGVAGVLANAIALLVYRHRLSSVKPCSEKTLLFGDIASQNQPINLHSLYQRTVEGARKILNTDRVIIYTFDENWNGTITAESVAPGLIQSIGNEIVDTCMKDSKGGLYKNGRICVINDIYQADLSACHIKLLEYYQIKANMVVPILQDDQLLGLIIAHQCDQARVWQQDDIDFFVQLTSLISLRLSRMNFLEQKAEAKQVSSFSNVALRIRESLDSEEIFITAATEIRQALNVDRVLVCRLNPSLNGGEVVAESVVSGWSSTFGLQLANLGIAERDLELLKNGLNHPISKVIEESTYNKTDKILAAQYQVKASLIAPIRTNKQLQGLIIAHQCSTTRTWEQPTIDLFEELATQVSLALEQATLLKRVATEAKRTQLLADFTSHIRQSFNSQDIFSISVKSIQQTLNVDRVLIYRFNPEGTDGKITSQAVSSDWTPTPEHNLNQLFKEENFQGYRMGSLWIAHDVYQADLTATHLRLLENLQIKASMVAPILSGDELVGLLCVHQCSERRDWQQPEFYLLKQLAAQIGYALDQAKLIEQVNLVSEQRNQQSEELRSQLIGLIQEVEGAAKGDLTVRAEVTNGELGTVADFFNAIIESLQGIVTQVKQATTQVNASLGDNEEAIRQLADVAFQQAQETTRTLDSVKEMTRSIQEVADSACQAAAVARTASTTAETGGEAMERTVQKILNLQETVAQTANKVKRLGESTQEISKVVSLINQIALQTNLLALNAGIEAARAGEEGQSFAVVAKEVGELAARSVAATKEIEQIVEKIQLETSQAVEAMELGTSQVVEGTHLVNETKQSLGQIVEVSRQIDQLIASISVATVSQVETSCVVTDLMNEIAKVSERAAESSHQISDSLQQTVEVARQLQASVEVFKVDTKNHQKRSLWEGDRNLPL